MPARTCLYVYVFFLIEIGEGEFKSSLNFKLLQEEKFCLSY